MKTACLLWTFAVVAGVASGLGDVPKGFCHRCEVTCFEDCAVKYDREIVQQDVSNTRRLSRKDTRVEAQMKRKMYGVVLEQQETAASNSTSDISDVTSNFATCLVSEQCPCPVEEKKQHGRGTSFLASIKRRCVLGQKACALGCVGRAATPVASQRLQAKLLQEASSVSPGPRDPDDAAIPWSINVHPVKINSFSTGRQSLERCMKSCLAATCGCDDAPGMSKIKDMTSAIRANDEAKDPVEDSAPQWQYRKASIEECGKGMPGKKVVAGLYADMGGTNRHVEVCSDTFFDKLGVAKDAGKKNCKSSQAKLAGCLWDAHKNRCVYGLKKTVGCYTRFQRDHK